ncbi:major facilitator superfamily transporter [Diplocarpon rosae]|nr:major facilitator superfamily transporter [Diplocarpon rosae]
MPQPISPRPRPKSPGNYGTTENCDTESNRPENRSPHGTDYRDQALEQSPRELSYDRARRRSFIEADEDPMQIEPPTMKQEDSATWSSLPHKSQLAILTLARLSEPLSYLFYQLRSFDRSLPASTIASQAGIMQGSFAAAQLCTAMLWGRFSDGGGRKRVLLIGLSGTMISCLGFGFSRTFWQALIFRMLGGALNGNVGVMRTMISEIVREKKYQSRAFLILPMVANIGSIVGPIMGGLTSDPAGNYSDWFGGNWFLEKFPYSPPNLISAVFLCCAALAVFFGLEETHEAYAHQEDIGITFRRKVFAILLLVFGKKKRYEPLDSPPPTGPNGHEIEYDPDTKPRKRIAPRYRTKLPFRRIFTYNVVCTLICHASMSFSMGTFQNIWYSFLSTPVYDPANSPRDYIPHLPLLFTGGIGLPPRSVGPHPSVLGTIHGIGQSASSAARTVGPALGGWLYGVGLEHGVVGAMFWLLACVAVFSIVASNWVREGDGHEIRLEGDTEAEAEAEAENAPLLRR